MKSGNRIIQRAARAFIIAVAVALALAGLVVTSAEAVTTYTISGTVTHDAFGVPPEISVIGFRYNDSDKEWRDDFKTTAKDDGSYVLPSLSPGKYKVTFYDSGQEFAQTWYGGATLAQSTTLTISTKSFTGIGANLKVGGTISGRVTHADGTAGPEYTEVMVLPTSAAMGFQTSLPDYLNLEVTSYGDGTYQVTGLRPGIYRVYAAGDSTGHPGFWLGQTPYFNEGETVTVAYGEESTGHDIALPVGGTLQGKLTPPTTSAAKGSAWVVLEDKYGQMVSQVHTDSTGNWVLKEVPPGDFKLRFQPSVVPGSQWYGPSTTFAGGTIVSLAVGATATINATLVYKTLKASEWSHITGTRKKGKTLTAVGSVWNYKPDSLSYSWFRDGKQISGAYGVSHKLTSADVGHRLTVWAGAHRYWYETGYVGSSRTGKIRN